MPSCSISNCRNYGYREKGDISFHHFPENPLIRKKWIEATGKKDWCPTKFSSICSTHFTKNSFMIATGKIRRLHEYAYPTINILRSRSIDEEELPQPSKDKEKPPQPSKDKEKPLIMPKEKKLLKQIAAKSDQPFGQCRSCLNFGYHKDITEYREVFLNCLNLQLSKNAKLSNMICISCVRQLNHAVEFRSMVVESERELLSELDSNIEFIDVTQYGDGQENEKIRKGDKVENNVIREIQENVKNNGAEVKKKNDYGFCDLSNFQNEDDYDSNDVMEKDDDDNDYNNVRTEQNENDVAKVVEYEDEDDNYILIIEDEGLKADVANDNTLEKKNKTSGNHESEDDENWHPTSDDHQSDDDDWRPGTTQNHFTTRKSIKYKESESQAEHEAVSKENKLADSLLKLSCPQCDYVTGNKIFLETHIKTHNAKQSYKCDFCPYITTTKRNLSKHTLKHTGEKPHACTLCSKSFSSKSTLEAHMILHTGEKPFACKICDKKFANQSNVTHHEKIHKDTNLVCKFCSKTYKCKQTLKCHVRTHFRRQRYTCNICGQKVISLQAHMQRHVKEKPHACDMCEYRCLYNYELRLHKLALHSSADDLPHACGICGKTFLKQSRLNEHIRLHTGEKPVACKFCKRKFRRHEELNTHMKERHSNKLRNCHKCGVKFDNIAHYNRHQVKECEGS